MNKKKLLEYILCAVVLFAALIIRLYKINNPIADWHSWRQTDTSSVTRIYVDYGINLFYPRYYDVSSIQSGLFNPNGYRFVEFPIYNALSAALYNSLGNLLTLEVVERLVSIGFTFVSAYFLYLIAKKYLGKTGGYFASFYFLFLPFSIYYSRTILPEPTLLAFLLSSIWFYIKYSYSGSLKEYVISVISFSVALLLKPYVIFYSIVPLGLMLEKNKLINFVEIYKNSGNNNFFKFIQKYKKTILEFLIFIILAVVPLLIWRWWESKFPEGIPFWDWAFNGNGIRFKPSYFRWIYGERIGHLILGGWGIAVLAFGLVKKYRENTFNQLFMLSAFVYLSIVASANVLHDYYQILILPPIAYALAQGSMILWNEDSQNKILRRGFLALSILVMFITSGFQIREYYNINRWEIVEAGKFVDENTPKDAIVIAPYNGDTAFLYQTNRYGWPFVDRTIVELKSRGAQYFVSVDLNDTLTLELQEKYKVIEKNNRFILINLQEEKLEH